MEMHQVRYFLAICEKRKFTQAAQRCGVAQPSLTRAIKKLEDELGGALFDRNRSEIRLTKLGNLVKRHMKKINQAVADIHELAQKITIHENMWSDSQQSL